MVELVTGHRGKPHVTALQAARNNAGILGNSKSVVFFEADGKFEMTVMDGLRMKLSEGCGYAGGRFFEITEPIYLQADTLENSSYYRRDRIVLLIIENNITGEERAEFRYLQGNEEGPDPTRISIPENPTETENENDKVLRCFSIASLFTRATQFSAVYREFYSFSGAYELQKDLESTKKDIDSIKQSFQDGCKKIAKACTNKGVSTADNASPDTIVTNIGKVYDKGKADGKVKWKAENLTITTDSSVALPAERATSCTITMVEYNGSQANILCPGPVGTLGNKGDSVTFNPIQKGGKVVTIVRTGAQKPIKCSYSMTYE
ncbi:hypothetical protein [Butyrivibrio sp. AD3002]|uniref:hypothetical protein n=1 Tax=Butyrivibrio sp. AD3002 TaxID=1280670 RepID=UPI0003B7654F|nr:hypothetical protein [Butyrivibrio sp. AD3002]